MKARLEIARQLIMQLNLLIHWAYCRCGCLVTLLTAFILAIRISASNS